MISPVIKIARQFSFLIAAMSVLILVITNAAYDAARAARQMTDAEKISVAEEMLDAWRALDWEKAAALFDEHGVLYNVGKEPIVGRSEFKAHLDGVGPGLTRVDFIVRNIGVIDGVVMLERVDDFDFNGHSGTVPVYGTMEIEDGKITVWREYYDHTQMRKAMGVDQE